MGISKIDLEHARKSFVRHQIAPQISLSSDLTQAFQNVPRDFFLDSHHISHAYQDKDLSLSPTRWALSSRKMAKLFSLVDFSAKPKMLIIGFNTGYSLALAYEMQAKVYGIEQDALLFSYATTFLQNYFDAFYERTNLDDCLLMEKRPHQEGMADEGPFDIIMIEGGVEIVPKTLMDQLRNHGSLVFFNEDSPKGLTVLSKSEKRRYHDYESTFVLEGMSAPKRFEF